MSIFLLFFFAFTLGAVATSEPDDGGSASTTDIPLDEFEIGEEFVKNVANLFLHHKLETLKELLHEDFLLHTCRGEYSNWDLFSMIPYDLYQNTDEAQDFRMRFTYAKWTNETKTAMEISLTIVGFFFPREFDAKFFLIKSGDSFKILKMEFLGCQL